MTLRLAIENMDRLPDGGPLRVEVKGRGLDIGRDSHLDWTLPDPSRHISSKHCEIRFREGGYWLHDVSTNGTFVNGAQFRLEAPYLLRSGDRLAIGQYIIAVEVEGQAAGYAEGRAVPASAQLAPPDLWGAAGEVAAPEDRKAYLPERAQKPAPDFLDFATGLAPPADAFDAAAFATPAASPDDDWLRARPAPPAPPARRRSRPGRTCRWRAGSRCAAAAPPAAPGSPRATRWWSC